jgi:hypothetical protein
LGGRTAAAAAAVVSIPRPAAPAESAMPCARSTAGIAPDGQDV